MNKCTFRINDQIESNAANIKHFTHSSQEQVVARKGSPACPSCGWRVCLCAFKSVPSSINLHDMIFQGKITMESASLRVTWAELRFTSQHSRSESFSESISTFWGLKLYIHHTCCITRLIREKSPQQPQTQEVLYYAVGKSILWSFFVFGGENRSLLLFAT